MHGTIAIIHPLVFNNLQGKRIARNFDSSYWGLFFFPVYIDITDGDCGCSLVCDSSFCLSKGMLGIINDVHCSLVSQVNILD